MNKLNFEVIAILSHDATAKRRPVNAERAIDVPETNVNRRGRKPVLLIASSLLPLAASSAFSVAQAAPEKPAQARLHSSSKRVSKARVPAAALAALARARRLMTPAMENADAGNVAAIEISLQHAIELAPEWLEARRVFARWKTSRHQWVAAATAWQAVSELSPRDREAQNEVKRAARYAEEIVAPTFKLPTQSLVRFGHDLSGSFDEGLWAAPLWKRHPLLETRVLAKIEKLGVKPLPPMPPLSLNVAVSAAAPVEKSPENTAPSEAPVVPIVPGVTTIIVPEEDGIPITASPLTSNVETPELPTASADVPMAARVALARARQLTGLVETLPEAEVWALTELQRAVELAPHWAQAQREMALWHEEHSDWNSAAQSWEKVAEIIPNDVQSRTALQNALRMAEAQNLWANRTLVTLGHDSTNPVGHGDRISTRVLAAPLPPREIEAGNTDLAAKKSLSTPTLPRLSMNEAVRVEAHGAPIALGTAGEDRVLLAQADTLVPVAPAPSAPDAAAPTSPTIDVGAPVANGIGLDNEAPATLTPVPAAPQLPIAPLPTVPTPPVVSGSDVNVKTVLPGASSLPKPVVKPIAKPVAKKPVKTSKRPVKPVKKPVVKAATSVSKKQAAAAWPWVNRAGKAMVAKDFSGALSYYQKAYALDPKNPYSLYGIPNTLLILKRYPEAIDAFSRFLVSYPRHPKGVRGLADAYTFSGRYRESAELNAQIVAHNPKDFGAALQAAQVLAWSKQYEESGRFYRMALAVQPDNGEVWTEYAETLSYAKDPRAREAFGRALQINSQSQRAMLGLANVLSWDGEYASAVPFYGEVLKSDPNNLKARIALADALTFSSRAAMAIPEYEAALKLAPDSPEARLGLGRALTIAKRDNEAIALLAPLVNEQPNNTEALGMLGIAQIANQPGAALTTFESLLKLQDQPAARAATLANIGDLRAKLNQPDEARAAYDEAVKLAPQDNKIALSYSRTLMRSALYDEAEPLLTAVLQRDPANQSALLLQATLAARTGQSERAAALTEQLQAMPLEVSDDALNLFYALRGAGEAASANRLLAQLAEAGSATPENLIKVANAVRDSGQEEASYALYQRVLQADPENITAHIELAEAYMRRKEFATAQKEVDFILARQPGSVAAKVMGATLALRRDRNDSSFDNATIVAREALEKDPNNVPARLLVAEVSSTRANFAQAVENYRAALENQPNNLQARLGLARNLSYLKQVDESIKEYQLLIQQVPDDATVKLELAQVYLDRNRLEEAQRLFVQVLKSANYPLPEGVAELARRVPGGGDIVSQSTQRALREFAAQKKNPQTN